MELQHHPSSATLSAPLACNADRIFRSRTFCSRRGRATVSPNPLFLASQEYPQQLNVMWYRKECDFKCQQLVNAWGAKILLSCGYPQQCHMHEANEIHTSEIRTEKGWFLASVSSASDFRHFSQHNKILRGSQRWQQSPQGTSVSHWMAIYLKGQWEIKVTTSNFCISHCVFRVHLLSVLNKQYRWENQG